MVRLISGLALGAAALGAIYFLPHSALRVLVIALAMLATHEYLRIASVSPSAPSNRTAHTRVARPLVYGLVALTCFLMSEPNPPADLVLAAALMVLLIDVLFGGRALGDAAASVAAAVYIGLPLALLAVIHRVGGRESVLLLIGTVVVSDSGQYYSGRALGRHPLAPSISPKKTIEGAAGGLILGTAFMVILGARVYPGVSWIALGAIGLIVVALGICGDLFESRLKRASGLKDSSSLIPGHGGVLDRIDALLFAAPAFCLFLQRWV
jgi:phosphatidate cytidylyltransferase